MAAGESEVDSCEEKFRIPTVCGFRVERFGDGEVCGRLIKGSGGTFDRGEAEVRGHHEPVVVGGFGERQEPGRRRPGGALIATVVQYFAERRARMRLDDWERAGRSVKDFLDPVDRFVVRSGYEGKVRQLDRAPAVLKIVALIDGGLYRRLDVLPGRNEVSVHKQGEVAEPSPGSDLTEPVGAGLRLGERLLPQGVCLKLISHVRGDVRGLICGV